jgi:hypothetical protein
MAAMGTSKFVAGGATGRPDSFPDLSHSFREVHRSDFKLRTSKIEGRIAAKE